jgi:hypothetical protein
MPTPTRHPLGPGLGGGVNNADPNGTLGMYGAPDPTLYHTWFDDFDNYLAAEWVRTATGAGTTVINTGEDGGVLLTTNAAADDDAVFYQMSENAAAGTVETFRFVPGKKTWFKSRMRVSDVVQSDFVIGLQITDTTPLAVSDGVYFRKDDGDSDLDFVIIKDSVSTVKTMAGLLANNTYVTLGFYYDGGSPGASGIGKIYVYVNDVLQSVQPCITLVDDEDLTVSFGIQNGEAVAKTMSVDYIFCSKER